MNLQQVQALIGLRIKTLRNRAKLSQRQLALAIGKEKTYISTIETGKANMQLDTMLHIANGLGVELPELFRWE